MRASFTVAEAGAAAVSRDEWTRVLSGAPPLTSDDDGSGGGGVDGGGFFAVRVGKQLLMTGPNVQLFTQPGHAQRMLDIGVAGVFQKEGDGDVDADDCGVFAVPTSTVLDILAGKEGGARGVEVHANLTLADTYNDGDVGTQHLRSQSLLIDADTVAAAGDAFTQGAEAALASATQSAGSHSAP
jgi:hypothetical protein